jgi:hypothetical protein
VNFSEALHDLNNGFLLRRGAWEEIMYVVKRGGYPDGIAINGDTARATGLAEGEVCVFHPYLMACVVAGRGFAMWVPTVADLFAEDWRLFPRQPQIGTTPVCGSPIPDPDTAAHTFGDPVVKLPGDALRVQRVD